MNILNQIKTLKQPRIVVLIDPDKYDFKNYDDVLDVCENYKLPFLLVGGSLVNNFLDHFLLTLREKTTLPLVIFPGNLMQISSQADAILLLSLISGRNPDLLIGNHVNAALYLKKCGIEIIPTGYMLIEGGILSSVQYMSQTLPIPSEKIDISVATAIAGELLGLQLIYLEAGSGAVKPIPAKMVAEIRNNISIPIVVGGGIKNAKQIEEYANAGAQIIVLGNSIENHPNHLKQILKDLKW